MLWPLSTCSAINVRHFDRAAAPCSLILQASYLSREPARCASWSAHGIVSYALLKEHYAGQQIYWGWSPDELNVDYLVFYKTGRTNANDGGIDFVMKPLGRFFQVTETVDAGKYFLDIDKVQRYPITFVVKSEDPVEQITARIEEQAAARYPVQAVVKRYMECVEEVINIPELMNRCNAVLHSGRGDNVIKEIVIQSRVEFNVQAEDHEANAEAESDSNYDN